MSIVICQIQSVIFVRNVIHAVEGGTPLETGNSNGGGLVAGCSPHTEKQILFHFTKAQQLCASRGDVLGSPSLTVRSGPVYVKQHWTPTRTLILAVRLPVSFIILYPHFHLQSRFALTVERVPNTLAAQLACRPILSCYLLLSSFPLAAPVFIDSRVSSRNLGPHD